MHQNLKILLLGKYIDNNFLNSTININWFDSIQNNTPHKIYLGVDKINKEDYDVAFIFNTVRDTVKINVVEGNLYAIMQEPGDSYFSYMHKGLSQYDNVFSPIIRSQNTIQSWNYLQNHLSLSNNKLNSLNIPKKTKIISCILSNKNFLKGHQLRYNFFKSHLSTNFIPIDFFGRGINTITKKEDALLDYKFSIAIENSSIDYYFTEKILDCFLCYTMPIYYGATNINKFFPEKSYIWIDINQPKIAINKIKEIIKNQQDIYIQNLDYIKEARELVLKKYHFNSLLNQLEKKILSNKNQKQMKMYTINPVDKFYPISSTSAFRLLKKITKFLFFRMQ